MRSCTILLACCLVGLGSENTALAVGRMPGGLGQWFGWGFGPGYHAPKVSTRHYSLVTGPSFCLPPKRTVRDLLEPSLIREREWQPGFAPTAEGEVTLKHAPPHVTDTTYLRDRVWTPGPGPDAPRLPAVHPLPSLPAPQTQLETPLFSHPQLSSPTPPLPEAHLDREPLPDAAIQASPPPRIGAPIQSKPTSLQWESSGPPLPLLTP